MGATTKKVDTTPSDITGLRNNLSGWLQNSNTQAPIQGANGQANGQYGQFNNQIQPFGPGQNAAGVPSGGVNPGGSGLGPTGGMNIDRPRIDLSGQGAAFMNLQSASPGGDGGQMPPWNPPPSGSGPAGPTQQGGFNNIFQQMPQGGPNQVSWVGATPMAPQINAQQISQGDMRFAQGIDPNSVPQVQAQQLNGANYDPRGSYMGVQNQMTSPFQRGQIRDATALNSSYGGTQSVDQLGGAHSAFFNNMVGQLQPSFDQQRAQALAQAKEGLGNMGNGTALANSLGVAMNRSLGDQQALLANYASQGVQTEVGRQLQDAAQNAQVGMANANRNLSAQQGNQQADTSFLSQLLGQNQQNLQGQIANQGTMAQLGTSAAQNALQAGLANQSTGLNASGQNAGNYLNAAGLNNQAQIANMNNWTNILQGNQSANLNAQNQNASNFLQNNQFNAGQAQNVNLQNAQLGQAYQQLAAQMGDANAQRYMQMLLGMSTTGVGPAQVTQSGGAGSLIGSVLGTGIGALAGGVGASVGGAIGKKLGGG